MKKDIWTNGVRIGPMQLHHAKMLVTKSKYFVKIFLMACILCVGYRAKSQTIKMITSGTKTSLRGLSVVSNKIIWASGSAGTVALSTDSGKNFNWLAVKGYEKTDFRDIEAWDEKTAIIMGIDSPGIILKTVDGGLSWRLVYSNNAKGIFLDAMDFNGKKGVVVGDPLDGYFFMANTTNRGNTWQVVKQQNKIAAAKGEAAFASSGTNIRLLKNGTTVFVSGGVESNMYINSKKILIPILQGEETTGANSVAVKNNNVFMVVGGDFNKKDSTYKNCIITSKGVTFCVEPNKKPTGYRSCVEYILGEKWITCGLNGVDISTDGGVNFIKISGFSFNTCRKAKNGNAVFFVGGGGRIGKLIY